MKRLPVRKEPGGCGLFLSNCAKSFLIALVAAFAGLLVGGNELRGVALGFFMFPVFFLGSMVYFTRTPKWVPPEPRKQNELRKKPR